MTTAKTKVLITTTGLSSVGQGGGISSYVDDLATNLAATGYEVTVYLIREGEPVSPSNTSYKYVFFNIPYEYKHENTVVASLLDNIQRLSPDIIINNDVSYISGLWPVLNPNMIKISVMHGFYHRHTMTNLGLQGKIACYNWQYADYIVCQNHAMCRDASERYHIPSDKFVCIHQTTTSNIPSPEKTQTSSIKIICACGQSKTKGAQTMFHLAQKLKQSQLDFHLDWCLPVSETWQKKLHHPCITFHGNLPRKDFLNLLSEADVIIIPTTLDTGPLLVVEALSTGTIPICNKLAKSAIPDLIQHGENGFLIPGNDPDLYMQTIEKLAKDEPKIAISKKGYDFFVQNLHPIHQIRQFSTLFHHKKTTLSSRTFSEADIVCFHLHNVAPYPVYARKRLVNKILTYLELPIKYSSYKRFFHYFLD